MRKPLNLSPEERKIHDNELHKKQAKKRQERKKREAYRNFVVLLLNTIEDLGWEHTELVVGADAKMVEAIVDKMMEDERFAVSVTSGKLKYRPEKEKGVK